MDTKFLTAYTVDRCYGGPEEGGWWYDNYQPIASIPVLNDSDLKSAKEKFSKIVASDRYRTGSLTEAEYLRESDEPDRMMRGEVWGEEKIVVLEEEEAMENQTKGRPSYE